MRTLTWDEIAFDAASYAHEILFESPRSYFPVENLPRVGRPVTPAIVVYDNEPYATRVQSVDRFRAWLTAHGHRIIAEASYPGPDARAAPGHAWGPGATIALVIAAEGAAVAAIVEAYRTAGAAEA